MEYVKPSGRLPLVMTNDRAYATREERLADNRFYASKAWTTLRAWFLARFPLCAICQAKGIDTLAQHVHHVIPRKSRPDLALNAGNLQSVCQPCHNAIRHLEVLSTQPPQAGACEVHRRDDAKLADGQG